MPLNPSTKEIMSEPVRKDVWKMFDAISPTYDKINRILSLGMDQRWRKKVASHLPEKEHLKILDLATGTGDQLIALFESQASIQAATGIDLAAEMLAIGQEKIDKKPYKEQIKLVHADAEKIPFADESFDAATLSFGIRNVTSPVACLKEIHRVLKLHGRCLILEFSLPPKPIKGFYLFYLRHILPRIGSLLSRNVGAYRYLNQTIETFPCGKEFCYLMREAEFKHIQAHPMALGAVTLYVGEKR